MSTTMTAAATSWYGAPPQKRGAPVWLIVAVTILVAAVASLGIRELYLLADRSRSAEVDLARLSLQVQELPELEASLLAGDDVNVAVETGRIAATLDGLKSVSSSQSVNRLAAAWARYDEALGELETLVANEQPAAAASWLGGQVTPARISLEAEIASGMLDANATSAELQQFATIGMVTTITLAAGLIAVLFLGNDRQRRRTIQAAQDQEERYRALAQFGADLVSVLDRDGIIRYQSPSIGPILGREARDVVGLPLSSLLHVDDGHSVDRLIESAIRNNGAPARAELRIGHGDGSWRVVEAVAVNLLDNPRVRGVVVNSRDITERKQMSEQLIHMAFHDPLTGLPNRALYMDRLSLALKRTVRTGEPVAVLFLDLDGFKRVNDTLGHDAGDELLKLAADRIRSSVRPADTVARLGGDEFTIVLDGADDRAAAIVARRLAAKLSEPIEIDGQQVSIGTSVGIAVKQSPADQPDDLLRQADAAMYQAKQSGKGRYVVFDYAATAESEVMGVAQ